MKLLGKTELARVPDLRHRLQQLRWFRRTFRKSADSVADHYGIRFDISSARLDRVFLDWAEALGPKKQFVAVNRADFIVFAAGLVLKEFIRHQPARATPFDLAADEPLSADDTPEIVTFWPEGFLYTNYCMTAVTALFEQEFGKAPQFSSCVDDLRTWWSYRENSTEVPAYAVAFLDRFLGGDPNWLVPELPESRSAMRKALAARPSAATLGHATGLS